MERVVVLVSVRFSVAVVPFVFWAFFLLVLPFVPHVAHSFLYSTGLVLGYTDNIAASMIVTRQCFSRLTVRPYFFLERA